MREGVELSKIVGLGLDPKFKGFTYMLEAICGIAHGELLTTPLDHTLMRIAIKFNVSPVTVENAIKLLLVTAWENHENKIHLLFEYEGCDENMECPTVKQFLYMMSFYVELGNTDPQL